jgi:hypothetical protein
MPNSEFQPNAVEGHEGSPQSAPAWAYALIPEDEAAAIFLTSWEENLVISGLPARFKAADPQTFVSAQIGHDRINRYAEFDRHSFQVTARYDVASLRAYFLTTPATPITVEIIRIAKGTLDDGAAAEWGVDTYVVQSGVLETIALRGDVVAVTCVPRPFHMQSGVPRLWFSRTCQHALYGEGCTLAKLDWKWESPIASIDRSNRQVTVTGKDGTTDDDHFTGGFLVHSDSGEKFTIVQADSSSGDTVLVLGHWSESLEVTDQLLLYPGCNRTTDHCTNKFSNGGNFGGFSRLPNRNPTLHGA